MQSDSALSDFDTLQLGTMNLYQYETLLSADQKRIKMSKEQFSNFGMPNRPGGSSQNQGGAMY